MSDPAPAERTPTAPPRPESKNGRRLRQLAELPVSVLRGVGSTAQRELAELGIGSVLDLITHYPRQGRYIDGTRLVPVASLTPGDKASVLGRVTRVGRPSSGYGRGRRRSPARVELEVADASGCVQVVFFNQVWRAKQLPVGTLALFFGSVGTYRGSRQLNSPTVEVLQPAGGGDGTGEGDSGEGDTGADDGIGDGPVPSAGRVFPVYPLTERAKLTSTRISRYVAESLDRAGTFADPLPDPVRTGNGLIDRTAAFNQIHRPASLDEAEPARRRLAFDELFRLQLDLVLRRERLQEDARGIRHRTARGDGQITLVERFIAGLGFELTGAQRQAMAVIGEDLAGPLPMHRLLQGDVGSGKTVVAVAALLVAVEGGHQGALMAPTEVLAEQHGTAVRSLVDGLSVPDPATLAGERPLRVALLTSRTTAGERATILSGLADGSVDVLIGTHALLTDQVTFRSLGVAVIDEQHRFGVEQRAALREKGRGADGRGQDPDLLVMTATPIPRTAAMVVFGDLDMTIIDELPPGRLPVTTQWARTPRQVDAAWKRVRSEAEAGRRAFVVCPLVEGSERVEATSVVAEAERLAGAELAGLRIGILHGQLSSAEKERSMAEFRRGGVDVLVATTVIEVGVDVPEATVMVIEDADRFGIAQLHQLRGRVGRGRDRAWCYLLSSNDAPEAAARLSALEGSVDGFALAEVDLELRGEGTILGSRQKGRSDLRLAKLVSDRDLVVMAREVAEQMVAGDPGLVQHELLADELRLFIDETEAEFLFKS
ncbi:MAG TPA: ATP-dependent DNA helicase RecG [Acidimicrobiales bacterium]|nr:ATP-dependent DNA helicase RecG [Acidimicrobiales bacterium]